ncbi:MAG: DUF262 domain-containing protein [Saprospiraceae bacterium]|nr:DUF262 domain-containing protein [Saprospiraceae bacterium]
MVATQVTLTDFLTQNKTQFVIPVYQRNYDWTEVQCKQLLEDIIEIGSREGSDSHFIGSIVFIHDGVHLAGEVKPLVIIDGQQRLTTITILYLALYKFALSHKMPERAAEINDTILINKFVKDDSSKLKLKQTDNNSKAMKFLMGDNKPEDYPEYSRLRDNYLFFFNQINDDSFEVIHNGLNRLLFVQISLERDKDDPQRIFESLNSTGLELSQADLIRNYILMGLAPKEQNRIFNEYWEVIENNAKFESDEESKVSDLIRDYMTFINKKIPNKNKVYEEFKAKFKVRDNEFYNNTLAELKQYAIIYNKMLNPKRETVKEISQELQSINQLEINVSYPFILPVYNDYIKGDLSQKDFIKVLKIIQSYTWRRFVLGLPTSALNKIFMVLYSDIDKKDYISSLERSLVKKRGTQRFPTDKEIETALRDKDMYNTQAKNRLYLFEKLEHFNNKEIVDLNTGQITIEHIFPQNPDSKWKSDLHIEDYKMFDETYKHTIGNLTLSGNNGPLGNKSFLDKKLMNKDEGEQGYIYSNLWLNTYLKTIDQWTITNLGERYNLIYNRFLKIWEFPKVNIIFDSSEEEVSIFQAEEPKDKKLEYYIFRNEKIVAPYFSELYTHIISELFKENPSKFMMTELKDLIVLTASKETLRFATPINDTYFIEGNLDSNGKFRKLKQILIKFEMEDELIIKYIR